MARNEEWEVLSFDFERVEQQFKCCKHPWVMLYAHLVIRRKPLYYIINLVIDRFRHLKQLKIISGHSHVNYNHRGRCRFLYA